MTEVVPVLLAAFTVSELREEIFMRDAESQPVQALGAGNIQVEGCGAVTRIKIGILMGFPQFMERGFCF
ncbi:hypothetical protein QRD43_04850 [Pelomonas sp. APW6]|uniref:Uncharacterized protein n=1 Tax=Roseateles subflavus TaxID=3053353 RepID=A0ABT7LEE9_9BURK|nr:hypothetical protein [Pelomonas sp. APW6]MDL5031229.1 hypothetical protein [Pelomonas sp. APW6]